MKNYKKYSSEYFNSLEKINNLIQQNEKLDKSVSRKKILEDYYNHEEYRNIIIDSIKKRNLRQNYIDAKLDLKLRKIREPINIYEYPSDNDIKESLNMSIIQNIKNFFLNRKKKTFNKSSSI